MGWSYFCRKCQRIHNNPSECPFVKKKLQEKWRGEKNPNWKPKIAKRCPICSKIFLVAHREEKRKICKECSRLIRKKYGRFAFYCSSCKTIHRIPQDCPYVLEKIRKSLSEHNKRIPKEVWKERFWREEVRKKALEKLRTPEVRAKLSESKKGDKNPMKRKEVRHKVSETLKRKYREGFLKGFHTLWREKREFLLRRHVKYTNPKKWREIRKMLSERMKRNNPMKNPEIAKKVREKLRKRGLYENGGVLGRLWRERREEMYCIVSERMRKNNPMHNPEVRAKRLKTVLKNMPYNFMGVNFLSKVEKDFCKWLVKIGRIKRPISGKNVHVYIGGKEFDFLIEKMFIELHPWVTMHHSDYEEYYNERRKILDENGYENYGLIVVTNYGDWKEDEIFKN